MVPTLMNPKVYGGVTYWIRNLSLKNIQKGVPQGALGVNARRSEKGSLGTAIGDAGDVPGRRNKRSVVRDENNIHEELEKDKIPRI